MLYLSNPSDLINTQPAADFSNLNEVFYSPPKSNWCLNYQIAENNGASGKWSLVRKQAHKINIEDFNPDPLKMMIFIDSFAYFNEWKNAYNLAEKIKAAPSDEPVFCARLTRLGQILPASSEKEKYLALMKVHFNCEYR